MFLSLFLFLPKHDQLSNLLLSNFPSKWDKKHSTLPRRSCREGLFGESKSITKYVGEIVRLLAPIHRNPNYSIDNILNFYLN